MTQLIQNGLYYLSLQSNPTLVLTIKQNENNEYGLYWEKKDIHNDEQKFYIRYNNNNNNYSIFSYSRSNSIGVKYETCEVESFIIETDVSFTSNCLWTIIPNEQQNAFTFQLQSIDLLSDANKYKIKQIVSKLESHKNIMSSTEHQLQNYKRLLELPITNNINKTSEINKSET